MIHSAEHKLLVLFDWDGTLFDSGPPTTMAWQRVLAELQCDVPEHVVESLFRDGWPGAYVRLTQFGALPPQGEVLARLAEARRAMPPARLFADVPAALRRLRRRGAGIALVTNSTAGRLATEMATTRIDASWFDFRVTRDLVARPKPAPDPYAEALHCLPPQTPVIAVEDSAVGVASAVAAGIPVLLLDRGGPGTPGTDGVPVLSYLDPDELIRRAQVSPADVVGHP